MNDNQPARLDVTASHVVGATAISPGELREKLGVAPQSEDEKQADKQEIVAGIDKGTAKELALDAAQTGIPIPGIGAASSVLALPMSWWAADYQAKRELGELTDSHREAIAQHMGVDPALVTDEMTIGYAAQNENLRSAIEHIAAKRKAHPISNATGVGGLLAGGAAGAALGTAILPVAGSLIGGLAGGMLGYEAGKGATDGVLGISDGDNPIAIMDAIHEKKANGNMIGLQDVFALRMAQNSALADAVAFHEGAKFHELDEGAQQRVIEGMPELAKECLQDATLCNFPAANLQHLMLGRMPKPVAMNANLPTPANENVATQWTSRVAANGSIPLQQGQFADAIRQQQAAHQQQNLEV